MTTKKLFPLLATLALCGCQTVPTPVELRIAERADAFAALDAYQQERVRLGHIQIGDTTNMLWMAFGEPTTISTNTAPFFPPLADGEESDENEKIAREIFAGAEWMRVTWTYVREQSAWAGGPPPPTAGFQPGAMFAPSPPSIERVKKIYILFGGVITDMDTQREQVRDN